MDNWDRYAYAYVNGNPVNFTDATGMSANYGHMVNQILKNGTHEMNRAIRNGIHGNNRIMQELAHDFNGLFPGHKEHGRFYISEARLDGVGKAFDSIGRKNGIDGLIIGGLIVPIFRFFGEHPLGYLAAGAVVACIVAEPCGAALAYGAAVLGGDAAPATSIAATTDLTIGSILTIQAGWRAGYLLGGIGGSSWNQIRWDARAANAGGFLGAAIGASAVLGLGGYAAWEAMRSWLAGTHPEAYVALSNAWYGYIWPTLFFGGIVYNVATVDVGGMAYTAFSLEFAGNGSVLGSVLGVPLIGWKGIYYWGTSLVAGHNKRFE